MGIPDKRHQDLVGTKKIESTRGFTSSVVMSLVGSTILASGLYLGCKLDSLIPPLTGVFFGFPTLALGVATFPTAWRMRREAKITESMDYFSDE
ncbi:MAG TPA: hypothetical protein PKU78_03485 [Candidatus Dojkabacteria bacterium]|nr:hypothetical protein [Candidatus Dojkabacteria bacterium]HRO65258.1 hypothetical protein [Candidatus Dojkabacteria bacterium]HRP36708.1 hypothetical protein [Candidatus Dojkabacteria bacterium]HRP51449.1 hypothetical protein [Candidatus Dojkabacteria bacterium]